MPLNKFEKYTGGSRDEDGYLILHDSALCARCRKPVLLKLFADVDKRRRAQIIGYCEKCFRAVMGW